MIFCSKNIKMNVIIMKCLLDRDRFMPEIHLNKTRFSYSLHRRLEKNISKRIRQDLFFSMIWLILHTKICPEEHFLTKVLWNAFVIASNLKLDGYQWGLAPMVYTLFDKKNLETLLLSQEQELFLMINN